MTRKDALRILGYRRTADSVIWPRTDIAWCAYYQALDVKYGTEPDHMPLGHDWRCPMHGRKPR